MQYNEGQSSVGQITTLMSVVNVGGHLAVPVQCMNEKGRINTCYVASYNKNVSACKWCAHYLRGYESHEGAVLQFHMLICAPYLPLHA